MSSANLRYLFNDALSRHPNAVAYTISHELATARPDMAIVETNSCSFDLEEYAREGQCVLRPHSITHSQLLTDWLGAGNWIYTTPANAWMEVDWQGHQLQVVSATFQTSDYRASTYRWILSPERELAERFFAEVCEWCAVLRGEVLVFDGGGWYKSTDLFESIQNATLENLILPDGLKEGIRNDFEQFFLARETYERYHIPWKRGVLFIGPPGNGKTHMVKALSNHLKQPVLYVKSLMAHYATEHDGIRAVFDKARETTPCLLILEDLDSLINDQNRSFFLNELDGFAANTGIVLLATTNHPDKLDPAIIDRPSRFDRKYHFDLPAPREREAYIRYWNGSLEPDLRLTEAGILPVVEATNGYSFAYLKELFLSSMMGWIVTRTAGSMDTVMLAQATLLREQMNSHPEIETPSA